MAYKILHLEDQLADSMKADLERFGYEIIVNTTDDFDDLFSTINNTQFDAFLFDFRLTDNKGRLDAPAIAQAIRTKGKNHQEAPIILISNESNLAEFDKDLTGQDLFDFTVSKPDFRNNLDKYTQRISSFIQAYSLIRKYEFDLSPILGINEKEKDTLLDYRLEEKSKSKRINDDAYAFCRLLNQSLIRAVSPLVGEDILAARLGVDIHNPANKDSWKSVISILEEFKYKGILSGIYDRWWFERILDWWKTIEDKKSLRRLSAIERVSILNTKFELNLVPAAPIKHATSSSFWTICMEEKKPLDPIDGYVINKKNYAPWQEMEYLSLDGALEQSYLRDFLSPISKEEIRKIEKDGTLKS